MHGMILVVWLILLALVVMILFMRWRSGRRSASTMREELVAAIAAQPPQDTPDVPAPVVSLEQFFDGNADEGSIGCNLSPHLGLAAFREVLEGIRARPEVQDVLVAIHEVPEEQESWPYSECAYVMTSAPREEVAAWVSGLHPDEIHDSWMYGEPPAAPELEPQMAVFSVWWD